MPDLLDELIVLALAFVAFDCFVALAVVRYLHREGWSPTERRLVLLDVLLAVAAFEVVADRLMHFGPEGSNWRYAWLTISTVCQGAIVAGGFALVMSYRRRWR